MIVLEMEHAAFMDIGSKIINFSLKAYKKK
jgi:hypothetical protein